MIKESITEQINIKRKLTNLKTRPPEMVLENKKKRQKGGYNIFCTALKYHIQFTDAQKGSENVSMVEIYSKKLEHDNSDRFTCMILTFFFLESNQ